MRQRGGIEQPIKGRRANRPKARKLSTAASSIADLQKQVGTLTRELKEANERQTATANVLQVINSSPGDLVPVFDAMLDKATRLSEAAFGILWTYDGERFQAVAFHNVPAGYVEFLREPQLASPVAPLGRVARGEAFAHVPDLAAEEYRERAGLLVRQGLSLGGFRTVLAVPMRKDASLLGAITIYRREVQPFSDKQIVLLQNFAAQAVIAMENARLLNELRQTLLQQTATTDVLKVISRSAFDLDTVMCTLAGSARDLCGSKTAVLFLRDGETLFCRGASAVKRADEEFMRANPVELNNNSHIGRAVLTGTIANVGDIVNSNTKLRKFQQAMGFRSLLAVPLMREGQGIGVFALTRDELGAFSQRQVDLVQGFADQAVIAIENVRLFDEVQARTRELAKSLDDLRTAQDRLIQTEKLASLGQLTAGIAHEIKNPLNFVNNFSAISAELTDELKDVLIQEGLTDNGRREVDELTGLLKENLNKVVLHGKRADSIVKNMLLHSREGSGERRSADINALVEESLNLAYHGARAERPNFNITLKHDLDPNAGALDLYPQEITRALLNLISNGFYAALRRKVESGDESFEPVLTAATRDLGVTVEIRIRDNGNGISPDVRAKMFNPFFTTKPTGEGTGLGLSMTHDIVVKQHGGRIDVETEPGAFAEFIITLPRDNGTVTSRKLE
ncbi:GAF domain-containing protein [Bradyrhizobium sp. Tv2a-2]|uniref:GAF domain-containing sensor histidine kinase n=1 Tax=Bradyrhizobium sp. Tv2a-2 TaxID=113395 RepID=UPI000401F0BB|nr:GAF domain-containing protein [Bradyrhizobium sp. Tv2a-2]